MEFAVYQELARRTQNNELNKHCKEMHALHGMRSEVGEIQAFYQKVYQGHVMSIDKLIDEAGDLLWFLAEYADSLGVTLDEIAERNIAKLRKRYPQGLTLNDLYIERCNMKHRGYSIEKVPHPMPSNPNRETYDIMDGEKIKKANILTIETAKHVIDTMIKYGYWRDLSPTK